MRTNTSLRVKWLIAYVYDLCARSGLCVRVRLCAQSGFFFNVLVNCWRGNESRAGCYLIHPTLQWPLLLMLSDSSDVAMTFGIMWPSWLVALSDPSKGCDILVSFLWWSDVLIGPSFLFGLQGSAEIFFWCTFAKERLILTLELLFDDEQYLTQWSNVTVHYALVRCSINYIRWYWG